MEQNKATLTDAYLCTLVLLATVGQGVPYGYDIRVRARSLARAARKGLRGAVLVSHLEDHAQAWSTGRLRQSVVEY